MIKHSESLPALPFYLDTKSGKRFCIHHTPPPDRECLGTFIYLHPFAEEMNKSRRMVALQARAFTAIGYGVLQIDLFGCGDSSGEFREARWNIWKQDIADVVNWLRERSQAPINLWGLRLGALLALDFTKDIDLRGVIDRIIMWQPILNGKTYLNQFLRLQLAGTLLSENKKKRVNVQILRNSLSNGTTLEVGGYELSPELAAAFDNLNLYELLTTKHTIYWLDMVSDARDSLSPAKIKIKEAWGEERNNLQVHLVLCSPFWATQEITECSELISATSRLFSKI